MTTWLGFFFQDRKDAVENLAGFLLAKKDLLQNLKQLQKLFSVFSQHRQTSEEASAVIDATLFAELEFIIVKRTAEIRGTYKKKTEKGSPAMS